MNLLSCQINKQTKPLYSFQAAAGRILLNEIVLMVRCVCHSMDGTSDRYAVKYIDR